MSATSSVRAGWHDVSLGDICAFTYGKSLPASARSGSGHPVFGSNGIVGAHESALTSGPTIVIGRKGSFGEVHFSEQPCSPIDTTYFVTEDETSCYLPWLARRLRALGLNKLNRAAAVPGLNREDAYRQRLLLPTFEDQKRISRILDTADVLIAQRRESIAQLDALVQSTFLEMFGDPVGNPKRWPKVKLGAICSVITGNTPSRERADYFGSHIEWIKSQNIGVQPLFLTTAVEWLSEAGKNVGRTAPAGSVLVTCIAGSKSSIGKVGVADRDVAFNQQINALIPGGGVKTWYLFGLLLVGKRLVQAASTNSMKGMVSKSALSSVEVPCPPLDVQLRFSDFVDAVRVQRDRLEAHLDDIDTLFASLQSRAFAGEL